MIWQSLEPGSWLPAGELKHRYELNRRYMMTLDIDRLMRHHEQLAGLYRSDHADPDAYDGWESAECQLHGHFVGHFLSACAFGFAYHGDRYLLGCGEEIVRRLRLCQIEHGDGWCFSIPREYLDWTARRKRVWAPQYTVHKTLMGLVDMVKLAGSKEALEVLDGAADWFLNWSGRYTDEQFNDILDVETGGMLEAWADLYALTGDERVKALIHRYRRPRVFEAVRRGEDPLTLMHANTTIPEALGYARAYEVLGDLEDLKTVQAYWDLAVEARGAFPTGGQTCREVWTPLLQQEAYLSDSNQEHCVVYNMIRLADFLWRHTGDAKYLDYIGLNYRNGILAQQNRRTGMVAYYLPMQAGARVDWGTPTKNFWCCHGTLVQVHNSHGAYMAYQNERGVLVAQLFPGKYGFERNGRRIQFEIVDRTTVSHYAPCRRDSACKMGPSDGIRLAIDMDCDGAEFDLMLNLPAWADNAQVLIDGEPAWRGGGGVVTIARRWNRQTITVDIPSSLRFVALPDAPSRGMLVEGYDLLAGLTDDDCVRLSPEAAVNALRPDSPGAIMQGVPAWRLYDGARSLRLIPVRYLDGETYTMCFQFGADGR